MTDYGQQQGTPFRAGVLHTREKQLWWAREWHRSTPADLGQTFNSALVPADFPDLTPFVDPREGGLNIRAREIDNPGNPTGTSYPRGSTLLIPDWLLDSSPDQMPPLFPNVTDDPTIATYRQLTLYARIRVRGGPIFFSPAPNPFDTVNIQPSADLFVGPSFYVGDQSAEAFPFGLCSLRQDYALSINSPDTPANTYSTQLDPPQTTGAIWYSRPASVSMEEWNAGPQQNQGYWLANWGNSIYVRLSAVAQPKVPEFTGFNCWISANGIDWQHAGTIFIVTLATNPGETAFRRVGVSVRGQCWAALDFVRIYYGSLPQYTSAAQVNDGYPWSDDDAVPNIGARMFDNLG